MQHNTLVDGKVIEDLDFYIHHVLHTSKTNPGKN